MYKIMSSFFAIKNGLKNPFFSKGIKILFSGILLLCLVYNSYATNFVVTSCNTTGAGTLDAAINSANGSAGPHLITFDSLSIAGCGGVINVNKTFDITRADITIDGYQAASPACGPGIRTVLNYTNSTSAKAIYITAANTTIRGLVITGVNLTVGIHVNNTTGCKIEGNYIGVTPDGLSLSNPAIQNYNQGIWLQNSPGNTVGGPTCRERNIVSNYTSCIEVKNSSNNIIINNYLGVNSLGTGGLINSAIKPDSSKNYNAHGVHVIENSANTQVLNNVIGSRRQYGIFFDQTTGNVNPGNNPVIRGNLVGLGTDSLSKIGNGWTGIFLHRVQNASIGGPNAAHRNYSCNNGYLPELYSAVGHNHGIQLTEQAGASNIENNVVGLSPNGKTPMPNSQDGISLLGSSGNTIKNNICEWNTYGIFLQGYTDYSQGTQPITFQADNNKIVGNTVKYNGFNPQNQTEGGGIALQFGASGNRIGRDSIGLGNLVDSNLTGITLRNDRINASFPNLAQYGAPSNWIHNNTITNSILPSDVSKLKYKEMAGVGIVIHGIGSDNNFIGGSQNLQKNTITQNGSNGVYIETGVKNWVFPQNLISCNGGGAGAKGIRLAAKPSSAGTIGNNDYGSTSPVAGHVTVNAPNTGSADASDSTGVNYLYKGYAPANSRVYIFLSDACYTCSTPGSNGMFKQGLTLKDSVLANASGIWSYSLPKPVGNGIVVYAAEPSGANRNTSELSQCFFPACIPPATAAITPNNPAAVCKGATVTLKATSVNTYIYTWYKGATVVAGPTANDSSFSATTSGSYSVRIADPTNPSNSLCYKTSSPVTVTVDSSTVPGSIGINQSVCTGFAPDPFTSIQGATGGNGTTSYQWQFSTDNVSFSNVASNGTSATYSAPVLTVTTYFRRTVKGGTCPATNSNTVTVSVSPVSNGGSIAGGTTVCASTNSGKLTLSGHVGIVQRWESSIDNFSTSTAIAHAYDTLTFINLKATTKFRAIVQSGKCAVAPSLTATVIVDSISDGGSIIGGQAVCSTTNTGILNVTGKTGNIVRWESSTNNFATVTTINTTNSSHTFNNLPATTQFRVIVKSGTCTQANSSTATVTVDSVSKGGSLAGGQAVCGTVNTGTITLSGKTGTIVRWESSTDNFATTSSISNTASSYTYTNLPVTTQFRAVVKSGSCAENTSSIAIITVDSNTVSGTVTGDKSFCGTTNSGDLKLSGNVGSIVRWESSTDNFATKTNINTTSTTYSYTNLPVTTVFRVIVKSGFCAESTTSPATIQVDLPTVGGSIVGGTTVCAGTNSGILNLNGNVGSIVRWESSADNFTTANSISNTNTSLTFTDLNTTTQYRAVVQSGSCATANSAPGTVTVSAVSNGGKASASVAEGCGTIASTILTLTGHTGTIQWQISTDSISWKNITGANAVSYTANNIAATTYYRAKVKSGVCDSAISDIAKITVSNGSDGGIAGAALSPICQNNSTTVTITGHNGSAIQWQESQNGTSGWLDVTSGSGGTAATYTTPNLNDTIYYRALVTSGSCPSDPSSAAKVMVIPVTPLKLRSDTLICEGTDMTIHAPSGYKNYLWSTGSQNQSIVISSPNMYWIKAETLLGCPVVDSIKIAECDKLTIPNVFTPNGDPLNQTFIIQGNRPNSQLEIYNRWGTQIYTNANYDNTWDGNGCTDGIYYYLYKRPGDTQSQTGWLEIIR